jgi:hypothetical protein
MATWITHLRLAEILLNRIHGLDSFLFAIGNRPFIYLSKEQMDRFVDVTAKVLYRLYERVWLGGADFANTFSALESLPYQPLGIYNSAG